MLSSTTNTSSERIGILWRGERGAERLSERVTTVLGPLFDAFAERHSVCRYVDWPTVEVEQAQGDQYDCQ